MSRRRRPETQRSPAGERLQKVLAQAGLGSRRRMEAAIEAGEVQVGGRPARLGDRVVEGQELCFREARYRVERKPLASRVVVLNKREGVVCTRSDPDGRPTVFDTLPRLDEGRWIAIGRLDINTSGLLLLTNDGELANTMMHPRYGVDREYACRVRGEVSDEMIEQLLAGVELEDGPAAFSDVVRSGGEGENAWFHVALLEGRNREVRRLWQAVGVEVSRLKRVRYGAVFLPSRLKRGQFEELPAADVRTLRTDVGLAPEPAPELRLKRLRGRAPRPRQGASGRR